MGPTRLEGRLRSMITRTDRAEPSLPVSERPALAHDVQLIGEMADSAFKEPQWLIERDGHFIQLPELIYRTAEFANGERTPDEIAGLVTESTEWAVTAEHIRKIVADKLVPLGIVRPVAASASAAPLTRPPASSPLLLRMRRQLLGPRVVEPITRVLQLLYAPVILVPLLIAIAVAHSWLYFHHGLAASIRDFAYAPGAVAPFVALLIASMFVHELGNASALRYGGGRARSIGIGRYLIYPAFYTDTTDSYRLRRWARVRTDLGGFYFQLIFALAINQLYFVLGQEWLLAAILLIDLDIAPQLILFVRFDWYWALTDLLGIPDLLGGGPCTGGLGTPER